MERAKKPKGRPLAKKVRDIPELKVLTITGQTVYSACLTYFIRARLENDHYLRTGFEGFAEGGGLCDAREIFYNVDECFNRIRRYYAGYYRRFHRSGVVLDIYRVLLENTDVFIVIAFILTCILTGEEDYRIDENLATVESDVGINLTKMISKKNSFRKTIVTRQEVRDAFNGLTEETFVKKFALYQFQLKKCPVGSVSWVVFNTEYNKRVHEYGERGGVRENIRNLYYTLGNIFNNDSRFDAVMTIFGTKYVKNYPQYQMTAINENHHAIEKNEDDKSVAISVYDHRWADDYEVALANRTYNNEDETQRYQLTDHEKESKKAWRVWEIYEQLVRSEPRIIYLIKSIIMSKKCNCEISNHDMDTLFYKATMPFYHDAEISLSYAFHMTRDLCFILRQQHARHANVYDYVLLLDNISSIAMEARAHNMSVARSISENRRQLRILKKGSEHDKVAVTIANLEQSRLIIHDVIQRVPGYDELATYADFDDKIVDIIESQPYYKYELNRRHLDSPFYDNLVASIDNIMVARDPGVNVKAFDKIRRNLFLKHTYVFFFMKEIVYPSLLSQVWLEIMDTLLHAMGLDPSGRLSKKDYDLLYDAVVGITVTYRSMGPMTHNDFIRRFTIDKSKESFVESARQVVDGHLSGIMVNYIEAFHDSGILKKMCTQAMDKLTEVYEITPLINELIMESLVLYMSLQTTTLLDTNRYMDMNILYMYWCRKDVEVFSVDRPWLCIDRVLIDAIEGNGERFNLRVSADENDTSYKIIFTKRIFTFWFSEMIKSNAIPLKKGKKSLNELYDNYIDESVVRDIDYIDAVVDYVPQIHDTGIEIGKEYNVSQLKKALRASTTGTGHELLLILRFKGAYIIVNDIDVCDALVPSYEDLFIMLAPFHTSDMHIETTTFDDVDGAVSYDNDNGILSIIIETREYGNSSSVVHNTPKDELPSSGVMLQQSVYDKYQVDDEPYRIVSYLAIGDNTISIVRENKERPINVANDNMINYINTKGSVKSYAAGLQYREIVVGPDDSVDAIFKIDAQILRLKFPLMTTDTQKLKEWATNLSALQTERERLFSLLDDKQQLVYNHMVTQERQLVLLSTDVNRVVAERQAEIRKIEQRKREQDTHTYYYFDAEEEKQKSAQRVIIKRLFEEKLRELYPTKKEFDEINNGTLVSKTKRLEIMASVKLEYFKDDEHFTSYQKERLSLIGPGERERFITDIYVGVSSAAEIKMLRSAMKDFDEEGEKNRVDELLVETVPEEELLLKENEAVINAQHNLYGSVMDMVVNNNDVDIMDNPEFVYRGFNPFGSQEECTKEPESDQTLPDFGKACSNYGDSLKFNTFNEYDGEPYDDAIQGFGLDEFSQQW